MYVKYSDWAVAAVLYNHLEQLAKHAFDDSDVLLAIIAQIGEM
jgi:hypothetical protein